MHIRIINPTITKEWESSTLQAYRLVAHPQTHISVVSLDWGPASIESYHDHALAVPDILAKVIQAERDGVDGVIIDCMGDPGLYAARELVRIPVVGPAEASMHLAAMLGHRFSVLTVLESRRPMMEEQVARYGLTAKLASVRAFNIPVLELEKDPQKTLATVIEVAVLAVQQDGAHVIIPGCTGLSALLTSAPSSSFESEKRDGAQGSPEGSPRGAARRSRTIARESCLAAPLASGQLDGAQAARSCLAGLAGQIQAGLASHGCEVPVLDPPSVAIKTAETLVSLGLTHSPRTFARPATKPYHWPGLKIYE